MFSSDLCLRLAITCPIPENKKSGSIEPTFARSAKFFGANALPWKADFSVNSPRRRQNRGEEGMCQGSRTKSAALPVINHALQNVDEHVIVVKAWDVSELVTTRLHEAFTSFHGDLFKGLKAI